MRILLIGARHNIVQAAKKLDFDVVLFENKERLKQETLEISDETHVIDWEDHERVVNLASSIHKMNPLDAVLSFGEKGVYPAGLVKEELGIKGNPLNPVKYAKNKSEMRKLLNHKGISPVKYFMAFNEEDLKVAVDNIGFPCIIKPVSGTASSGVFKINTKIELDEILNNKNIQKVNEPLEIIVEEYLEGPEYSVETLSFDGSHHMIGITEKFTTGEPSFIETGHFFPATSLHSLSIKEIEHLTIEVLNEIGHEIGPAHTEIILTKNGPKIIETHTRPGGDNITRLMMLSYGMDVFYLTLKHFKGWDTPLNQTLLQHSGIKFNLFKEGIITEIKGLESLKSNPNIEEIEFNLSVGNQIKRTEDSLTRHGYVVFTGYSREKLTEVSNLIDKQLQVSLRSTNG